MTDGSRAESSATALVTASFAPFIAYTLMEALFDQILLAINAHTFAELDMSRTIRRPLQGPEGVWVEY